MAKMNNDNTGNWNTGHSNTGNSNTGNWNTGGRNTGNWNTGDRNTGNSNTGNRNSGHSNIGLNNTGHSNTGDSNTGIYNTGYLNTGNWNTGSYNTGFFNSVTPEEILVFNKPCKRTDLNELEYPLWINVSLTKWVNDYNMSDKEKEEYPSYKTTGGYLKHHQSLKEAYIESWKEASEEDRELIRKIPNFDEDVFEEVFGFNPWKNKEKDIITIDGVKYKKLN